MLVEDEEGSEVDHEREGMISTSVKERRGGGQESQLQRHLRCIVSRIQVALTSQLLPLRTPNIQRNPLPLLFLQRPPSSHRIVPTCIPLVTTTSHIQRVSINPNTKVKERLNACQVSGRVGRDADDVVA